MRRNDFICDRCGTVLERYGSRYVMRIEKVPKTRSANNVVYDLCPECSGWLKVQMAKHMDSFESGAE